MENLKAGAFYAVVVGFYLLILVPLLAPGCEVPEAKREQQHAQWLQRSANEVVNSIEYIKDPRTELCFAYNWIHAGAAGGPSLATVPCEAIPPDLLTVAEPNQPR